MAERKRIKLPAYFDQGMSAVLQEAASRDNEYAHYWIKADDDNRQVRRSMGWGPCEDAETLKRLGLGDMLKADGRAHYMDTELWRMPRELQDVIHEAQGERQAQRSDAMRKTLQAMADETKGVTKGAVIPYVGAGGSGDLLVREKVAPPVK